MTVQVGSRWVVKTNEPWGAGVWKGEEVEVDSILNNEVHFLDEDDLFWYGNIKDWCDHMEPYYTPKAIVGTFTDTKDNVNNPAHYGQGRIEAIEYIEDFLTEEEYQGYLRGNIAKYLHRFKYKNGLEDLKKAQWYLNRLIEQQEKEKDP